MQPRPESTSAWSRSFPPPQTLSARPSMPSAAPGVFLDQTAVQTMVVAFLCSVDATHLYFSVWKHRIIYLMIKKKNLLDIIVLWFTNFLNPYDLILTTTLWVGIIVRNCGKNLLFLPAWCPFVFWGGTFHFLRGSLPPPKSMGFIWGWPHTLALGGSRPKPSQWRHVISDWFRGGHVRWPHWANQSKWESVPELWREQWGRGALFVVVVVQSCRRCCWLSLLDLRMAGLRMELIQGKVEQKKVLDDNVWTPRSAGALCPRSTFQFIMLINGLFNLLC